MSRDVSILSISAKVHSTEGIISLLKENIATISNLDMVVLPETCTGDVIFPYGENLPFFRQVGALAKEYHTYITLPVYIATEKFPKINASIVFDRQGKIVGRYEKVFPYWGEFDDEPKSAVTDGSDLVIELDFGKVGFAICFDANFPTVWRNLVEKGAELVIWSSAYSAGRQLEAHALNHHYYIVTSTLEPDFAVYDIDGREIFYYNGQGEKFITNHIVLDLDRCIFHENFNEEPFDKMLAENIDLLVKEKHYPREQWFIVKSLSADVNVRSLSKQYGMEELRDYKARSFREIEKMRK